MPTIEVGSVDGHAVYAEVTVPRSGDVGAGGRVREALLQGSIARTVRWVKDSVISEMAERPERIAVEFGLTFDVKSGQLVSVLAEASTQASVSVRLEWDGTA